MFVYTQIPVSTCVCRHTLAPASVPSGGSHLRPPPCLRSLKSPKHAWLFLTLNMKLLSEVSVRERWTSGCYEQGTRKRFSATWQARQQRSLQRSCSHKESASSASRVGEGRCEHVGGIRGPRVSWRTASVVGPWTAGTGKVGGVSSQGSSRECAAGTPFKVGDRVVRVVRPRSGSVTAETESLFVKGLLGRLGLWFVGRGVIVPLRKWGIHCVLLRIYCSSIPNCLLSLEEPQRPRGSKARAGWQLPKPADSVLWSLYLRPRLSVACGSCG